MSITDSFERGIAYFPLPVDSLRLLMNRGPSFRRLAMVTLERLKHQAASMLLSFECLLTLQRDPS